MKAGNGSQNRNGFLSTFRDTLQAFSSFVFVKQLLNLAFQLSEVGLGVFFQSITENLEARRACRRGQATASELLCEVHQLPTCFHPKVVRSQFMQFASNGLDPSCGEDLNTWVNVMENQIYCHCVLLP